MQPLGETENKTQRKVVVAARSLWLPCFPASYTAVLCSLSPGVTWSWRATAELATCWEARGFVCFVWSRADKGKVVLLELVFPRDPRAQHAAGVSHMAQGSAGLLQPVEGRYPSAQRFIPGVVGGVLTSFMRQKACPVLGGSPPGQKTAPAPQFLSSCCPLSL